QAASPPGRSNRSSQARRTCRLAASRRRNAMRNDARPIGEPLGQDHNADREENDTREPLGGGPGSSIGRPPSEDNARDAFETNRDPGDEETARRATDPTLKTKI